MTVYIKVKNGVNLNNLLQDHKIEKDALSEKMDIKKPTLNFKIRGDRGFSENEIEILLQELKMKFEDIFPEEEKPKSENKFIEKQKEIKFKNQFTDEEVIKLKEILKDIEGNNNSAIIDNKKTILDHNESIIKLISNRTNRVKTTYNMDIEIKKSLDKYATKTGLNKSDIVNIALEEFLKK
jgi:hypothetical protein